MPTLCIPANHLAFVDVATRLWQRADIIASCVKLRPSRVGEPHQALKIPVKTGRLGIIHVPKLALMACHKPEASVTKRCHNFAQLPYGGWLASVSPAQVFRVFQQHKDLTICRLS